MGDSTMTPDNPLMNLLAAPLSPDWTVDGLAEQLLNVIASQSTGDMPDFVLDGSAITDRRSQRLLRPLLAHLATKSAAETGSPPNLYGGRLSFKRSDPEGPLWIVGEFENRPGAVRVTFRPSRSQPENSQPTPEQLTRGNTAVASSVGEDRPLFPSKLT
jgi:hypothetical protein